MIDDEDEEEEVLKKGISLKSVLKNLLMIILIIVGALFIYLGGGTNITNFFIGFSFICLGSTLIQIQKRPSEPIRQTLSILKCNLCGVTKVRNYQSGDFVFKKVDTCNDCNEAMEVSQIYSVKLKKPVAPKKEDSKKEVNKPKKRITNS